MSTAIQGRSAQRIALPEGLAGAAAAAAAIASIAGFVPGLYRDPAVVVAQAHGYDVGNLIAVAVLAAGLAWLARGSVGGRLVAIGALGCLVYSYVTYAFLIVLNPVTPLYIAVLGLSAWAVVTGLLQIDESELESTYDRPLLRRTTSAFMLAVVVIFAVNWLRQLATGITSGRLPSDLIAAGWPMNPVWVLDLGLVLPLIGLGGVRLLRRRAHGRAIAISVLVFQPLLLVTLLAMTVSMAISGQALDLALVAMFGAVALISAVLAALWLTATRLPSKQGMATVARLRRTRRVAAMPEGGGG
jgi:hypothetical protein